MINKPTRNELIMYYVLANPISSREILFSNLKNLIEYDRNKFSEVRKYQFPMVAFDSLFLPDKKKSEQENFEMRRGMAESFNLGGRLTGKSLCGIKTDIPIAQMFKTFTKGVIDSFDKLHLDGIINDLIEIFNHHPIFKEFKGSIQKNPDYSFTFKNGVNINSVNNKIEGKAKGDQWCQKHVSRDWAEEASYLTPDVTNKKFMAKDELGMIQRLTGMTEFTSMSPVGKLFFNLENKNKIINLPSFVNPNWTDKDEKDAIEEFDGRDSPGYQVQILGKVIESCASPYDMERVRACYNEDLQIKSFEINKDNFKFYQEFLVLERLINAEKVGIYMDIGEGSAPTEIIVIQSIKKLRYTHNITINKGSPDELYEIVRFIISKLSPNIVGYDNTGGVGKALGSNLSKDFAENLMAVDFNSNIAIDYEKDNKGEYIVDKGGNYTYKEVRIDEWSVQRLRHLFSNRIIEMPFDYKFDKQIQNVIVVQTGMRTQYKCKTANHIYQAFQVMAIAEWQTEFLNIKPITKKKIALGVMGSI